MKFQEYNQINYSDLTADIRTFWEENQVFERSITIREGKETFTFYEGPPSANGTPGIHHVMARTVKDVFCRYKTLKGYQVKRKGGWDAHGLPVELQVEKELGITKSDIGKKISIEKYNQLCEQSVMKYKNEWEDLTKKMGYWVDLQAPYITSDKNYIESVWHLLKCLFEKKLLYRGYTVQPYSPAAGTGLSSHELNQPGTYKTVKDTSITAQFKVKYSEKSAFLFENSEEDVRILAWTTTPWTLPSNCALAVGDPITYVMIRTFNPYTYLPVSVILAQDLISSYFSDKAKGKLLKEYKKGDKVIPFEVSKYIQGKDLIGIRYEPLMPYVMNPMLEKQAFRVILGDFVSTEEGTGIVHTAALFGTDDFRVCQQNQIPPIVVKDENGQEVPLVDKQGRFMPQVTDFAGKYVREEYENIHEQHQQYESKPTDVLIAIKLKEENKAFKVEKYSHSYPHCWRTDKPILYYPLDSWFIRTTAVKDRLIALNKEIHWKPTSVGTGRFGNWLENLVDWNLSRSRYWGTPLPIWVSEDKSEMKCIGSIDELRKEVQKSVDQKIMTQPLPADFNPHRPFVDQIILVGKNGKKLYRDPNLIDVWFDSGAMPYAQWHYPFEHKDTFAHSYPADFIAEGVDQTRGWFFTLHAISVLLYDKISFKNVISNGLVLDKKGNKMSKRLGNTINPFDVLNKYGADAVRWYMISNANPWDDLKFDPEGVAEIQRKFFGTFTNIYSFFALYANLDQVHVNQKASMLIKNRPELDRWILSKLQLLIQEVNGFYETYEPTKVARAIEEFVNNQLSNWYVRLSRKRFWKHESSIQKQSAYQTLYECLINLSTLMSPIAPFYSEWIYQNLTQKQKNNLFNSTEKDSVHLTQIPTANLQMVNHSLCKSMELAQNVSSMIHAIRKKAKIRVRQPLSKMLIPVLTPQTKEWLLSVENVILNEVNVKEIHYIEDTSQIVKKKIIPNFKALGKKYGSKMKKLIEMVKQLSQEQILTLEKEKYILLDMEEEQINLALSDVTIHSEDITGWSSLSENGLTVALDLSITDDLRQEGLCRDVVNRIQNLRKEQGLHVQDKIMIQYVTNSTFASAALNRFMSYIQTETLAVSLNLGKNLIHSTLFEIDDIQIEISIQKNTHEK